MTQPTPGGEAARKPTPEWTECEALVADYQMGEASFSDLCQRLLKFERDYAVLQARNEALRETNAALLKVANYYAHETQNFDGGAYARLVLDSIAKGGPS